MKLLIINTVPFDMNGISQHIVSYCSRLNKHHFKCDYIINGILSPTLKQKIAGEDTNFIMLSRNKKALVSYMWQLTNIIKQGNYDVVHIHGNSSTMLIETLATLLFKKKTKVIVHAHAVRCDHSFFHQLAKFFFRMTYDYLFTCSSEAAEFLSKGATYTLVNNAIDCAHYEFKPSIREKKRIDMKLTGKKVLLHVGNFNQYKNHFFLINLLVELIKKDKTIHLLLVGNGEHYEDVKAYSEELGVTDYISYLGQLNDPASIYQAADIFLLPSLYESFGTVLLEAQCSGLPCIVSTAVPKKVKLTEEFIFLPIDNGVEKWDYAICHQKKTPNETRKTRVSKVREAGYDINQTIKGLERKYREVTA